MIQSLMWMESDAVYNSPEEVIVNDREKSIPRVYQEYTKSILEFDIVFSEWFLLSSWEP